MGIMKLTPVIYETLANKSWHRFTTYEFAAGAWVAPLVTAEVSMAVSAMPMAFVRKKDTCFLAAILSLTPGKNLFVNPSGQWMGRYVPSYFRSYPFALARMTDKPGLLFCVDESSGLVQDTGGQPFFDENREMTGPVKDVLDFLKKVEQNRAATRLAVDALDKAGVITRWQEVSDARQNENEPPELTDGLYRIDEKKLHTLDDTVLAKLHKVQALPVAYGQIFSTGNLGLLESLQKLQKSQQPEPVDIQDLFEDDGTIIG